MKWGTINVIGRGRGPSLYMKMNLNQIIKRFSYIPVTGIKEHLGTIILTLITIPRFLIPVFSDVYLKTEEGKNRGRTVVQVSVQKLFDQVKPILLIPVVS